MRSPTGLLALVVATTIGAISLTIDAFAKETGLGAPQLLAQLPRSKAEKLPMSTKPMAVSDRRTCNANGQPGQCYHNGSACYLIVLVCYECCYDNSGGSKGESGSLCGICFGFDF